MDRNTEFRGVAPRIDSHFAKKKDFSKIPSRMDTLPHWLWKTHPGLALSFSMWPGGLLAQRHSGPKPKKPEKFRTFIVTSLRQKLLCRNIHSNLVFRCFTVRQCLSTASEPFLWSKLISGESGEVDDMELFR